MPRLSPARSRLVAPAAVAVTALAALLAGPVSGAATAAAAPAGAAASAAAPVGSAGVSGTLRHVSLGASATPVGKQLGTPSGLQTPELPPEQGAGAAAVRSHSVRPAADSTFAATAGLFPPVVASSPVGGSAGLGPSWDGLNGFQQRYANGGNQFSLEPPDQGMCVGGNHVVEAVNDVLRVFTLTGTAATGVVDLNSFLGYPAAINRTTGARGPFVTDPSCVFDHGTKTFFLTALTIDTDPASGAFLGPNHIDMAVSRTSDPTGGWNIYRLPVQDDGTQGTPSHKGCPCIGDYPHVGTDANAVFVTTNEYPFSSDPGKFGNNFNGAQVYAYDKRALAAGSGRVNVIQFSNTTLGTGGSPTPGFTLWPAQVPDTAYATAAGGTEYFLGSVAGEEAQPTAPSGMADHIAQYAVTNTSTIGSASPSLRLRGSLLPSQVYGVPPRSSQKVGPVPLRDCLAINCLDVLGAGAAPDPNEAEGPLDSNDSRMQQVYYSGGTLYGALDTVMQVQGNLQAGVAWFAVAPGATPASSTVAKQGYVGVAHNNINYPALAVLPDGTGAMSVTLVGRDYFPTSAYVPFGASGPGAVQVAAPGAAPTDGFSEYNIFSGSGVARPRWGDYGAAVTNGSDVYIANEYIADRCSFAQFRTDFTCGGTRGFLINWATRISRVTP